MVWGGVLCCNRVWPAHNKHLHYEFYCVSEGTCVTHLLKTEAEAEVDPATGR